MQQPGATRQGSYRPTRQRCKREIVRAALAWDQVGSPWRACSAPGVETVTVPGALPQAVAFRAFGALKLSCAVMRQVLINPHSGSYQG